MREDERALRPVISPLCLLNAGALVRHLSRSWDKHIGSGKRRSALCSLRCPHAFSKSKDACAVGSVSPALEAGAPLFCYSVRYCPLQSGARSFCCDVRCCHLQESLDHIHNPPHHKSQHCMSGAGRNEVGRDARALQRIRPSRTDWPAARYPADGVQSSKQRTASCAGNRQLTCAPEAHSEDAQHDAAPAVWQQSVCRKTGSGVESLRYSLQPAVLSQAGAT